MLGGMVSGPAVSGDVYCIKMLNEKIFSFVKNIYVVRPLSISSAGSSGRP